MNGGTLSALLQAGELLAGFAVVTGTLGLLWALTALMSRTVARWQPGPGGPAAPVDQAAPATPGGPATAPAAQADGLARDAATGPDEEELAAIAAAVALMIDEPHRVVRVRPQPSAWGQEGRRDTHASHRMPR